MMSSSSIAEWFRSRRRVASSLGRSDEGAILVEFAMVLPMLLLVFAILVEGSRIMWSYQSMISGVRDATRYLARVLPADICIDGGSPAAYASTITGIVGSSLSGDPILATGIVLDSVTPTINCHAGNLRGGTVAVAEVSAVVTMTFPFGGLLELFGGSGEPLQTTITDQSRIFGA